MGRGGEVAATTFDNLQLSKALKLFKLNWYKFKDNKYKPTVLVPAMKSFRLDFVLAYWDAAFFGQFFAFRF